MLTEPLTSYRKRDVDYPVRVNAVAEQDTASCEVCGSPLKAWATKYCGIPCYRSVQRSTPVADRFWAKVKKSDGCWLWTGSIHPNTGYGQLTVLYPDGARRPLGAHRLSWELANGPLQPGQWVLHRCDRPACVRPDHLFLGTHKTNMEDAASKGRLHRQRPKGQTVSDETIRDILTRVAAGELKAHVARDAGVSGAFVTLLVKGLRRQHPKPRSAA